MRYYHGTDKEFVKFSLDEAQEYKDFGKGIYLAVGEKHALKIAMKKNGVHAFVRIYDFDIKELQKSFTVKIFKKDDNNWIDFVLRNRNTRVIHDYDIIIGPTADADAQDLLESFYRQHRHKKATHKDYNELRKNLQTHNFPVQMCINTQRALDYIENHYVDVYDMRNS